jgi:L-amino acid N-acyltransferase YncA
MGALSAAGNVSAAAPMLSIRKAEESDFDSIWPIFKAVVATGDTYVLSPTTPREDAFRYWFGPGIATYVAEDNGVIVGMYKLIPNQRDLGSHVANAAFMVSPEIHGRGIGKLLGQHCLKEARRAGYLAMQFNYVVSTNEMAVALWMKLGFSIVGTIPKAFRHEKLGYVDVHIMHRFLHDIDP